jgi:hypothetical protein
MKVRNRHRQATMRDKLRAHRFSLTTHSRLGAVLNLPFETSVTCIMLGSLHFKAPMAIRGATKSVLTLTLFLLVLLTMHHTATSTLPTCWMILFSPTRAQ